MVEQALELDADDIVLGEVTPAELEAEAEALQVDVELEFAELEDAAEELDEAGAQAGRAVTARDAANSAATGRLRAELQRIRDEVDDRTGGLTAHSELASRLDLEGAAAVQAAAATASLGLSSAGSLEEQLRCSLAASMEETMWGWLNRSAQREAAQVQQQHQRRRLRRRRIPVATTRGWLRFSAASHRPYQTSWPTTSSIRWMPTWASAAAAPLQSRPAGKKKALPRRKRTMMMQQQLRAGSGFITLAWHALTKVRPAQLY